MKDLSYAIAVRDMRLGDLGRQCEAAAKAGYEELYFEAVDGHFARRLGLGVELLSVAREQCDLPRHLFLAVDDPDGILPLCLESPADIISVPIESCRHHHRVLSCIKEYGKKAGIVLQPGTPLTRVEYLLGMVDRVILHAVELATGASEAAPTVYERIRILRESLDYGEQGAVLQVCGAVTPQVAAMAHRQGATGVILDAAGIMPGCADLVSSLDEFRNETALEKGLI